jgi:hypothetical protein
MPWSLPSAIKRLSVSSSQKTCQLSYPAILEPHQSKVSDHARFSPALMGILASFLAVTPSQGQVATAVSVFQTKTQAAISSGKPFSGVTLVANADWVAGSTHQSGTAQIKAGADGSGSLQLDLGEASRTEVQTKSDASRSCTWTDHAEKSHDILGPNCLIAMPWFAPSLFTQPLSLLPALLSTIDEGDVVKDGEAKNNLTADWNDILTGVKSVAPSIGVTSAAAAEGLGFEAGTAAAIGGVASGAAVGAGALAVGYVAYNVASGMSNYMSNNSCVGH